MGTTNRQVTQISLVATQIVDWFSNETVILRDDGIPPDDQSNDGLFTGTLRLARPPSQPFTSRIMRSLPFSLSLAGGTSTNVTEDVAYAFGVIDKLRNHPVTQVASNVYRTRRVVNIVDPLLLSGVYPNVGVSLGNAAKAFYKYFPDEFDWLVFTHLYNGRSAPAGSSSGVKNAVQGIGLSLFNSTATYGSAGRLRSIIQLYFKHTGPMSHEIFHTWGVFGFQAFGMVSSVGGGAHWGALASATNSTIFGFPPTLSSLTQNATGNYCGPYGSGRVLGLELYLMGLAPASAIGSYQYVSNSAYAGFNCGGYEFTGTGIGVLDGPKIISTFGSRVPAYPDQNSFRAAVLVVSDRPLMAAEWDYVSRTFEAHTGRFASDYDGHAQISYLLDTAIESVTNNLSSNQFVGAFTGPPGRYAVLTSSNLSAWSALSTITTTNETGGFVDVLDKAKRASFYRIQRLQ
ncbi:MAG: hypothetical protein HY706_09290 [Candidatus Hydrogenedentes bacterium]|nr:hypothetical protein [Candidatus Hydrogenedentota bacterium]